MTHVAFDTETFWMNTAGKAQTKTVGRLVCGSFQVQGKEPELYSRNNALERFNELLYADDTRLIGHNTAFDLLVMIRAGDEEGYEFGPRVFELLAEGRFHDTMIRQKLLDIADCGLYMRGGYGLADLTKRLCGYKLGGKSGGDAWRYRYNELDGVAIADYPEAAAEYAKLDAVATMDVFEAQDKHSPILNEDFQVASSVCLKLISAWGLRIDGEWTARIDDWYAQKEYLSAQVLLEAGIRRPNGSMSRKVKQEKIADAYASIGVEPPRTDPSDRFPDGQVQTSKATLRELQKLLSARNLLEKGDYAWFEALINYNRATKFRSTYLEPMLDAAEANAPLCPRYNTIVGTGRTSSSGPNIQNFVSRTTEDERLAVKWFAQENGFDPKSMSQRDRLFHPDGFAIGPDIRGCVVPREGHVFVGADYKAIEMAGLAQVIRNLTGELTALGEAINNGDDLHLRVLADWKGRPYSEVADYYKAIEAKEVSDPGFEHQRFLCKSANYGFSGGASAETWVKYVGGMGADIDLKTAEEVRDAWFRAWPEMNYYFNTYVSGMQAFHGGPFLVDQHGPDRMTSGWRLRATDRYTAAANSPFQGICACGAKMAIWMLTEKMYFLKDNPLYGSRVSIFEHDGVYTESPREKAKACGEELSATMVEGMKVFLPDIEVVAEYKIMEERWAA